MTFHTSLAAAKIAAREASEALIRAETMAFWPGRRDAADVLIRSAVLNLAEARRLLREIETDDKVVKLPLQRRPRAVTSGDNFRPAGIEDTGDALTIARMVADLGAPSPEPAA